MTCSFTASLPQSASSLAMIVLLRKKIFSSGSFLPSTSIICMSSCKPHDSNSSRAWGRRQRERREGGEEGGEERRERREGKRGGRGGREERRQRES